MKITVKIDNIKISVDEEGQDTSMKYIGQNELVRDVIITIADQYETIQNTINTKRKSLVFL